MEQSETRQDRNGADEVKHRRILSSRSMMHELLHLLGAQNFDLLVKCQMKGLMTNSSPRTVVRMIGNEAEHGVM